MQKFKYISASIFLSIFSLLLLHQAFPHNHQQHELVEVAEGSSHHHHTNDHHHHNHGDEENNDSKDQSGFLDFLLNSHSHSYHSNDFQIRNVVKPQIKMKYVPSLIFPEFEIHSFQIHIDKLKPIPHFLKGHDLSLATISLRGPPYLA